jgi:2-oxoglutarate dehydrogenase dihydrolipoamide succinyltransferase (E2 component)
MPVQVLMPQLGESVDEGTISKWLKEVGEEIKEMEPLVEVTTDKVDTEIPSPASGVLLKIETPVGEVAQAGMVIAWIGAPDEQAPGGESHPGAPAPAEAAPVPEEIAPEPAVAEAATTEPAVKPAPGRHPELGFISPVVARLAREFKIDLAQVAGSGSGGRITKRDVLNYLERKPAPVQQPTPQTAPVPAAIPSAPTPVPTPAAALPGELIPHDKIRRSIAEHMVHSKRTSPHVTTVMEVDLSSVVAHRAAHKGAFARDGVRLTFTPYFVAATVAALKAFPNVNSSWQDDGLLLHRAINIGMATSLGEAGLIVPVIHNADALSLLGLARLVNDLAERARNRQLKPDEVKGGTFTITNHGISGSLFASPIINQPQCGILGVGAIQKRVVVISEGGGDMIAIRPMAYLSLTFDHRILDGASADGFLGKVVESLQNWS